MPDTTVFQAPLDLDETLLKSNGFNSSTFEFNNRDTIRKMYLNEVLDGVPFGFTYYLLNNGYPTPMFLIQMSLPRILHGHNAIMLRNTSEIYQAVSQANLLLRRRFPWLSSVDIADWVLNRIDLCYDHRVGKHDQDYLIVMQHLTMRSRKTFPYVEFDFPSKIKFEGVEYRSRKGKEKASFYSKWLESRHPLAKSHLRQEKKMSGPGSIAGQLGIADPPTIHHLTFDRIARLLEKDLAKLGLKDKQITNLESSSQLLIDKYGYRQASSLIAYLAMKKSMTREQMLNCGAKERTIQRNEKLIADAGLTPALCEENVSLPPLSISF